MPVWLAVGVALLLLSVFAGRGGGGPVFGLLLLSGLLVTAYGVGQYMRQRR